MTILVAYVARPEGQAALDKGIEIATERKEDLVVVNAGHGGQHEERGVLNGYEAENIQERLTALPIKAEFKQFVRGKNAVEEIKALVEQLHVSMLIIGLRGRSPIGKLLLGSVAQEILISAPCPVLAVKAGYL